MFKKSPITLTVTTALFAILASCGGNTERSSVSGVTCVGFLI